MAIKRRRNAVQRHMLRIKQNLKFTQFLLFTQTVSSLIDKSSNRTMLVQEFCSLYQSRTGQVKKIQKPKRIFSASPFFDEQSIDSIVEGIRATLKTGLLTDGPEVEEFERICGLRAF